jgi:hypothetical protein
VVKLTVCKHPLPPKIHVVVPDYLYSIRFKGSEEWGRKLGMDGSLRRPVLVLLSHRYWKIAISLSLFD